MRITRRWTAAMAALLMLSAVPVSSYGAVITYSTKDSSAASVKEGEEGYGPGYVILEEEEQDVEIGGPRVEQVSLSESYHPDYLLYEESMADLFFLYSNIGNGGITHEPVYVEIPTNVLYTMEKDGLPYDYTSGQLLSAKGTYVLRLTAVENPELPLSEQTEYQSTFRFRIQDEPPVSDDEAQAAAATVEASLWNEDTVIYTPEGTPLDIEAIEEDAKEAVQDAEEVAGEVLEGISENVQEGIDNFAEEAEGDSEDEEPAETASMSRIQVYEPTLGKYVVTLENGLEVISTVPEGYIGPTSVGLTVAEGAADRAELYCDDVQIEFVSGNSQLEPGAYRLVLDGCSYSFTIAHSVSSMDVYPAPTGMRFTEVRLNEENVELASNHSLSMKEDGTYTIFMEGEEGEALVVTLLKDTTVPEVSVTVNGGSASIAYVSQDIDSVVLEKDGAVVEGFGGTLISEPGEYRLTVADGAGNTSAVDFVLKYQINMYGVFAIVLVIVVIAAIAAFVLHTKKNMKIR